MKRTNLTVRLLVVAGAVWSLGTSSHVWAQTPVKTTPTTYQLTMKKLELCTDSACTGTTLLAEKDQVFDIASVSANQAVGSYVDAVALPIGTTYTHLRATVDRSFTLLGGLTTGVPNSTACLTDGTGTGTAAAVNAYASTTDANASGRGSAASAMTLVVPNADDATNGPYDDLTATFASAGISLVDANTMRVTIALSSSFTVTATPPTITTNFDVANTLDLVGTAGNACNVFFEPPNVTVSIQ